VTIKEECAKRNVDRLFHFTPVDHLDSILEFGLMTPESCDLLDTGMTPNDKERLDNEDAICLSVEWPNWKLYWKFHLVKEDRPWALIQIEHRVLWEKNVCFNNTNAADASMSSQSFKARQGKAKFLEMFDDYGLKKRADLKIPDNFTTNHQAEVLCLDSIDPEYFTAIHLNNYEVYKAYKAQYPNVKFIFSDIYFKYRSDWNHW